MFYDDRIINSTHPQPFIKLLTKISLSEYKDVVIRHVGDFRHQYPINIRSMLVLDYVNQVVSLVDACSVGPDPSVDVLESEEAQEFHIGVLAAEEDQLGVPQPWSAQNIG